MWRTTPVLEIREDSERRFERRRRSFGHTEHVPQIDDLKHIHTQIAQVVLHCLPQLGPGGRREPRRVFSSPGADFCHDDEIVGVRM
jgi:hypothetical protein